MSQINILCGVMSRLVAGEQPDLSARQMSVLLNVYLNEGPHTIRGLAALLNISKPAVTRAVDRLSELDYMRRKVDPMDRRSVILQRTPKGQTYLAQINKILESMADHPLEEAKAA